MAALLGLALLGAGCGGKDPTRAADQLEKVAGTDNQTSPAGGRISLPLAVMTLASDGTPVPRVRVRWRGTVGGQLSDTLTLSDANGRAQIQFAVGSTIGSYPVTAQLALKAERVVTFTSQATAAPVITSVTPTQFTGGDIVTIQGVALSSSATVEVGGAPARVTSGGTTSLTVVAPICLAPGQTQVRAWVSGAPSNVFNGTYVASGAPIQLAVGEYASIDPSQLSGCSSFPATGLTGAEYLVAPQAVNSMAGLSADYRLSGDSVVQLIVSPQGTAELPPSAASAFHDFLRQREAEISRMPRPEVVTDAPQATAAATAALPKVGDQREFRVCAKLPCVLAPDFAKVTARVKYVGSHVAIYQDNAAPAGGFTDAEFATLGQNFNDVLYDVDTRAFGVESDVDLNGLTFILFTPVVNALTARDQCTGAVVVGFFYAIDIDPVFAADQRANQAELFYSVVPDPQGSVTCAIAKDKINQIVPATFIHEFQHMISYGQHVLLRYGTSEDLWMNEAMSHLAEELGGLKYKELGNTQAFSDFVIGDLFNAYQYLKAPGTNFTLYSEGSGTLAERGGSWLFLRWVVDKFGAGITRRLEETRLAGTENIAVATGEPMSRLLAQWFLANYVSDLPGFTAPERLRYDTWAFRTTYASLNQQQPQRYDRPFPLVPQVVSNRTFAVTGTLRTGSGEYFRVVQGAGQKGFTLRLTSASGAPISDTVLARLNVIRIK